MAQLTNFGVVLWMAILQKGNKKSILNFCCC